MKYKKLIDNFTRTPVQIFENMYNEHELPAHFLKRALERTGANLSKATKRRSWAQDGT